MKRLLIACAALALAGCAGHQALERPEAQIITKEVSVPTPVPCAALAKLGPEPAYDDTDAALRAAPDIFEQTKLLLAGRLQRTQRLIAYTAAKVACSF